MWRLVHLGQQSLEEHKRVVREKYILKIKLLKLVVASGSLILFF